MLRTFVTTFTGKSSQTLSALLCSTFFFLWCPNWCTGCNPSLNNKHYSALVVDDAEALQLAAKDILQSSSPDFNLLGRVIGLQLTLGHHANAKMNLEFLRAQQPNDGRSNGPMGRFFSNLAYTQEINDFNSTIKFLDDNGVGHFILARRMKATMVSRAARGAEFRLAEGILTTMNPELATTRDDSVLMAGQFLAFPLCDAGKTTDAVRIVSFFSDSKARLRLGESLAKRTKNDSKIIQEIDKLIIGSPDGVSSATELRWNRFKLDVAFKSDDTKTVIALYQRCRDLGDKQADWLKQRVGMFLKTHGDDEEARVYLKSDQQKRMQVLDKQTNSSFSKAAYGIQLFEDGELEKVIREFGSLKRHQIVPQSVRLRTSRVQPLASIGIKLASENRIEEAVSMIAEIEDKYWRSAALLSVAKTVGRKNAKAFDRFSKEALENAQSIQPQQDRVSIVNSIVGARVEEPKIPFGDVIQDLKNLSSDAERAECLGDTMEWRIRRGGTPDQINQAVDLIVAYDPNQLYNIVDILMYEGQTELAASSLLKLGPQAKVDLDRYPSQVFAKLVEKSEWPQQSEFISKSPKSVHGVLLYSVLQNPKLKQEFKPVVFKAALKELKKDLLNLVLYKEVLIKSFELEDFEALGELTAEEVPAPKIQVSQSNQDYLSQQLKNLVIKYAASNGSESFDLIESNLSSVWSRQALLRAKVQSYALVDKSEELLLGLIGGVGDPTFRAELRYLSVAAKLKRKILVARPYW